MPHTTKIDYPRNPSKTYELLLKNLRNVYCTVFCQEVPSSSGSELYSFYSEPVQDPALNLKWGSGSGEELNENPTRIRKAPSQISHCDREGWYD